MQISRIYTVIGVDVVKIKEQEIRLKIQMKKMIWLVMMIQGMITMMIQGMITMMMGMIMMIMWM
jgi:hypothetical protein